MNKQLTREEEKEFDELFTGKLSNYVEPDYNIRKVIKAHIATLKEKWIEEGRKMKGSSWREGYEQGREEERERIKKDLHDTLWNSNGSLKRYSVSDNVSAVMHYFLTPKD